MWIAGREGRGWDGGFCGTTSLGSNCTSLPVETQQRIPGSNFHRGLLFSLYRQSVFKVCWQTC